MGEAAPASPAAREPASRGLPGSDENGDSPTLPGRKLCPPLRGAIHRVRSVASTLTQPASATRRGLTHCSSLYCRAPARFFEKYPALVTGFFFFMW